MPSRIEQYALIGDTHTVGLVADDGSLDWLCVPRFDSPACFAALLGDEEHGRWLLAPAAGGRAARRRYRDDTLILETEFDTPEGSVRVIDFMSLQDGSADVVRIVEGIRGRVPMNMELVIRFDYGSIIPWVFNLHGALRAVAGPDAVALRTPVHTHGKDLRTVASFTVARASGCRSCSPTTRRSTGSRRCATRSRRCARRAAGGGAGRSARRTTGSGRGW